MRRGARAFVALVLTVVAGVAYGQDGGETPLLRGYRQIVLGRSFAEVEQLLYEESSFFYRGEPDVSLRPSDGNTVIDARGRGFVARGVFYFVDDALYSLNLYLNRASIDYFQLYERLRARYGEPDDLNPRLAVWDDERTRIELEKPLTVRYIDLTPIVRRQEEEDRAFAAGEAARRRFLEEF